MHKHLLSIAVAGTLTGTLATPALAQTGEASPFTGGRIEALTGYDMLRSGSGGNQDAGTGGGGGSIKGVMYGIGLGYDFDLRGVVAGVEGEISDSTGKHTERDSFDGTDVAVGLAVGRDLYVGGRIGFRAGSSTLVYAKGGYTNTAIKASVQIDAERFQDKAKVDGFRLGAGVEQMFGAHAYGRLEYRYSNYGKLELAGDPAGEAGASGAGRIDLDRHQVVVAFGLRF